MIGADQVLALGQRVFDKPDVCGCARTCATARAHARAAQRPRPWPRPARSSGGTSRRRRLDHARLLRCLSRPLPGGGRRPRSASIVGAYEIEGRGIQLFERIEGDHFTIIGLPLLPLLAELQGTRSDRHMTSRARMRHRLAGRPFALAADPRLLAEAATASRAATSDGRCGPTTSRLPPRPARAGACRLQCHHAAQGGGLCGRGRDDAGRRAPWGPPTRCGSRMAGSSPTTPSGRLHEPSARLRRRFRCAAIAGRGARRRRSGPRHCPRASSRRALPEVRLFNRTPRARRCRRPPFRRARHALRLGRPRRALARRGLLVNATSLGMAQRPASTCRSPSSMRAASSPTSSTCRSTRPCSRQPARAACRPSMAWACCCTRRCRASRDGSACAPRSPTSCATCSLPTSRAA